MTSAVAGGILGVWNDWAGESEVEYEAWYQEEHVPERLACPGFRQARRYEAVEADRHYFTWYALDSVASLSDPVYLDRLEMPTPRTRAIMPSFHGMIRSALDVTASAGRGIGGFTVCLRRDSGPVDDTGLADWLRQPGVVAAQAWQTPAGGALPPSGEMRFRSVPDGAVASALVVECLRANDAYRVANAMSAKTPGGAVQIGIYRLLCCTDA